MKCLTVRQPWAHAIIYLGKRIENRSWKTDHRGPLAIHAACAPDRRHLAAWPLADKPDSDKMAYGAIIGVVELVDCLRMTDLFDVSQVVGADVAARWAFGPWCWVLDNPRPICPVPCSGQLKLFDVPGLLLPHVHAV